MQYTFFPLLFIKSFLLSLFNTCFLLTGLYGCLLEWLPWDCVKVFCIGCLQGIRGHLWIRGTGFQGFMLKKDILGGKVLIILWQSRLNFWQSDHKQAEEDFVTNERKNDIVSLIGCCNIKFNGCEENGFWRW